MLALIPAPLQTAGERALFAELARWDTGGSVRAAVVASLPLVDGPLGRRQSDAVLLVPEGIAVIRIVEVVRQAGVVTAKPEGSWTIAADDGPTEVLQLAGGGSTPLDGLMRAGMDTAVKLRRAGLEPGRIARLTVLVGEVTGLEPADGDLGEGDHVATLDPRSLLLAIARTSRHAGVGNPRLWTTADVRAALEALEFPGRAPSVEELNGEAFPYSPYVLRRSQLLTPAAMNASPMVTPPAPGAAEPSPPPSPNAGHPLSATGVARAVAASVASAHAAAVAAAAPAAPVPGLPGQRDTVEVDRELPPPRTAVLPAAPPAEEPPVRPPLSPAWGATASGGGPSGGSTRTRWVIAAVVLALVVLGATGVGVLLGDGADEDAGSRTPVTATDTPPAGPAPGEVRTVDGTAYSLEVVQVDDTCAGHAYGKVAEFFTAADCEGLSRALYSASVEGAPAVVSVSRVAMADAATARQLRELTDTDGSGNVSDLLREGVTYAGGPAKLSAAQYASAVSGPTVTVVETAWADPASTGSVAALDKAASDGLALPVPPPPGG